MRGWGWISTLRFPNAIYHSPLRFILDFSKFANAFLSLCVLLSSDSYLCVLAYVCSEAYYNQDVPMQRLLGVCEHLKIVLHPWVREDLIKVHPLKIQDVSFKLWFKGLPLCAFKSSIDLWCRQFQKGIKIHSSFADLHYQYQFLSLRQGEVWQVAPFQFLLVKHNVTTQPYFSYFLHIRDVDSWGVLLGMVSTDLTRVKVGCLHLWLYLSD